MSQRFYDVVVLGRSLGTLTAAALLARRDFRVLLLGQRRPPPTYQYERHRLQRRAFTPLFSSTPTWRRVLQELAQTPQFRRLVTPLDPMFQVLMPECRLDVPPERELFSREVNREFSAVRQIVDELYEGFARVNSAADVALERDATLPPGTWWERFEARRVVASLPYTGADAHADLLGRFPMGHPFRDVASIPTRFATDLAPSGDPFPTLAMARLHGSWTRGLFTMEGGEKTLEQFLADRIEAHGGTCLLDGRAVRIVVERGRVAGIQEDGDESITGCSWVISDDTGEQVADLARGEGITAAARRSWPHVSASAGRFVVSVILRRAGLNAALRRESFLVPEGGTVRPNPRRPVVHLQRYDLPDQLGVPPETRLVAETMLPTRGVLTPLEAREAVLSTLRTFIPFLDEHLVVVDSPHDGLPLLEVSDGRRRSIDRIHLSETASEPEPMIGQWQCEPRTFLDLAGEPVRGPIPGTLLAGSTVIPALGQEGQLIAAWSAARLVTGGDRTRQKMRRQMWSRVET